MMQRILKGDTSGQVALALANGFDYSGATVEVRYQGVVRRFSNCSAGQTIQFAFTAEETAPMAIGAFPVDVRIVRNDGHVVTVTNAGVKIAVTDCVADVRAGSVIAVDAHGGLYGIDNLPANYTIKDIRAKINEIITRLGGSVAAVLCAFACEGASISIHTAALEDVPNAAQVVTNATFDASGLATTNDVSQAEARAKQYTDDAVTSAGAVTSNVVTKAYVESLGIEAGISEQRASEIANTSSTQALASAILSAQMMTNDATIVRGVLNEYNLWDIHVTESAWSSIAGSANQVNWSVVQDHPTTISGYGITDGVTQADIAPIETNAQNAVTYAQGIYQYITGNTNAWFSGTNYVVGADATNRTAFAWESGMNAASVPCSLSLLEVREGQQKTVWDQRDWTAWYWSFKAAQLSNDMARVIGAVEDEVETNRMSRGWAKYTAVRGLDNPDPSALIVDTPNVQLLAGHQWEKLVEVGGSGYWTLTGNGIEISTFETTNTFLTVKDFEGNACITLRKTSSYLSYCECGTDVTSNYTDGQGRVVFHLTTDVQPTAEFSTTLELDSFVKQGESGCPANHEWTGSSGNWDCHFILKPGVVATCCFARFKVTRQGENVVEHTIPIKIDGGIVFDHNGQTVKIRPSVTSTAVGSAVNWVVSQ